MHRCLEGSMRGGSRIVEHRYASGRIRNYAERLARARSGTLASLLEIKIAKPCILPEILMLAMLLPN